MTNVLRMVPRSRVTVDELWGSSKFPLAPPRPVLSDRCEMREKQARTGTFPRPGTLFASTLKGKGSAMSVSVLVPASGRKNQRAEALQ